MISFSAGFTLCLVIWIYTSFRNRGKKYRVKQTGQDVVIRQSIEGMHFDEEGRLFFDDEVYRA